MKNKILKITKDLVRMKTNPQNFDELKVALDCVLRQLEEFTVERFDREGSQSALVYNTKVRPERFKIVLNGHLDVIPGKPHQYEPKTKDGKLFGVGTMDMKANLVCMLLAFKDVAKKVDYPLALQIVTDEEIGGFNGTKFQIEQGVRADFVISGETTNFDIVNKAKGVLWLKITCRGVTAHGAYPWKGENAVWKMNAFLNELRKAFPIPTQQVWETTVNLSRIETNNQAFNKIPDECAVWLDIRFVPEDKSILERIYKLTPPDFNIEIVANESELLVEEDNPYLVRLKKVTEDVLGRKIKFYGANGSSDARHFTKVGDKGVEFGPIGGEPGTDEEWVDIDSLVTYYEVLKKYLFEFNG